MWQRSHEESLKTIDGWVVKENQSQGGLVLQPLVPLSAHAGTKVEVAGRVNEDNIKG